jgi:hypothetical protein
MTDTAKLRELIAKRKDGLSNSTDILQIADGAPALLDRIDELTAALRVEHNFRIADDEITRIRNNGCGNDWPKVWNVQLNELCDAYRELRRIDAHLLRKEPK